MIRINLVEHLTSPYESLLVPEARSKMPLVLLVVLIAVVGGGVYWWSTQTAQQTEAPSLASQQQNSAKVAVKKVSLMRASLADTRSIFSSSVDFFAKNTPSGIALTDFVFQASGHYLVRGLSDDSSAVSLFTSALRKGSVEVKEGEMEAVGASRRARSFVRYGLLSAQNNEREACVETLPSVAEAMSKFEVLARKNGLKVEPNMATSSPLPLDDCEEVIVTRSLSGSYAALASVIRTTEQDKFPIGFQKLKMQADQQEQPVATLEMVVRYKPQQKSSKSH